MRNLAVRITPVGVALLTAILIILKLIHIITCSWWWILSPIWIPIPFSLIWVFGFGSIAIAYAWLQHQIKKNKCPPRI